MSGDGQREPKLLDQVRRAARVRHLSLSTEKSYVSWIRRFILCVRIATVPDIPHPTQSQSCYATAR